MSFRRMYRLESYTKAKKVIESCITLDQLAVACNYITRYYILYNGKEDKMISMMYEELVKEYKKKEKTFQ